MSSSEPVILIHIADPHTHRSDAELELFELRQLVKTYGTANIVHVIQHRTQPDTHSFIGSGKVQELARIVAQKKVNLIVLNAIANPRQIFHLIQALWSVNPAIKVWDRVELILNIFKKHARTAEAKLQIEIAEMSHMGPRIYGLGGTFFSRQGGGIGGRGIGETNIELMKRHWRSQIKKKRNELLKLEKHRERNLKRRKEIGLQTISIVGYTNAGKTSLFNLLTKKNKTVKDALFETLDSTTGTLFLPGLKKTVLLSDTIGFIQNLPASLISAFTSTLLESIHADLLLHVVDISDPESAMKIQVVEDTLDQLGILHKKQILVCNKTDIGAPPQIQTYHHLPSVRISSLTKEGIPELITAIEQHLSA